MLRRRLAIMTMGGSMILLLAGCTSTRPQSVHRSEQNAARLGADIPSVGQSATPTELPAPVTGTITLETALTAALLGNPELAAYSYDLRAAEALVMQAQVLPNPSFSVAIDEYDRDGQGSDSVETSFVLGQQIELGGKRRWRTRVADAEGQLAEWDYESTRLNVFTQTAQHFMAVMAAQQKQTLAESAVQVAKQTLDAVNERVNAGKEPPLQAAKSEAEWEMARLDVAEAKQALRVARARLASMWGDAQTEIDGVAGTLDDVFESIPTLAVLQNLLPRNPDMARWESELQLREAALSAERAARVPALDAEIGVSQFEEDGTDALSFGIGVPIPLFDRNQGNISAASLALSKAEAERSAATLALNTALTVAHADLTTAHQRIAVLRGKVLPAMEQAFAAAHEGYQLGKFEFLDMLDAQRGLSDTRGALVDAFGDYHIAKLTIQRITATDIQTLMNPTQEN